MMSDPRVFFASERTMLAWLRTGIAIVGLGFIISRFGLFIRMFKMQVLDDAATSLQAVPLSHYLGISFVCIGALCIAFSALQHGRFIRTLPAHDKPAAYHLQSAVYLGLLVAFASALLAVYLMAYTQLQ